VIETESWVESVDGAAGRAVVRPLASGGGCGSCSGRGCGSGGSFLGLVPPPTPPQLTVRDRMGFKPGQRVVVGLPEGVVMRAAFAHYLAPLAGLFLGGGLVQGLATALRLAVPEGVILLGAVAGMLSAFYWLRGFSRRLGRDPRFEPLILRESEATACATEQAPES
jgi:sigma-E factor negative regulatory protein RseC